MESGSGFEFVEEIKGGAIPREYIPSVEKGVREAVESGVVSGYPMTDLKVTLIDGSSHEVDSSDMAFRTAAIFAIREGVPKGRPVLLEPIMKVEVVVPKCTWVKLSDRSMPATVACWGWTCALAMLRRLMQKSHWLKCSVMRQNYAQLLKAGAYSQWNFDHYAPVSEAVMKKIQGM